MAGKDSSEEKKHPPTLRRLNELRREGQVPRSQDLPPALSLVLAILVLLATGSALFQRMGATMASDIAVSPEAFGTRVSSMIVLVSDAALIVLAPVFVAAMLGLLLASIVDAGGLPISVKSVTPDLTQLNPVEGFKRIFGLPSLINLVKGVIKIVLIGVAIWFVVRLRLNDMLWAPTCGLGCLHLVTIYLVLPLIVLGAIILLVMALIDLKLARWIFKRENKMTETELKRDRREDLGDPLFKGARRQIREEIMAGPRLVGIANANVIVVSREHAVALRYVRGETPAPVVVAKGSGATAQALRMAGLKLALPIVDDGEVTGELIKRGSVGNFIPGSLFNPVARVLLSAGVIGGQAA
jgi:type III secretion protein U